MSTIHEPSKTVHQGRNVRRFREMLNLKQEALATLLGGDWSQRRVSAVEGKEEVEPEILNEIAAALKVSPDAIKSFNEEAAVNYFNTFHDTTINGTVTSNNFNCNFNPIDKLIETVAKNEKLYEALLRSEREKVELLQKLLEKPR